MGGGFAVREAIVLQVTMLGGLTFATDGCRLRLDLGFSGRLLAAYLFEFPGRVHRRGRLADLFWHDLDSEHARTALNTAIWRLRKLLALELASRGGSNLYSSGQEVTLELASWISVDTHRFDDAVHVALSAQGSTSSSPNAKALEDAARSYSGSFLDGCESDWIIAERERLHSLYVRCLSELLKLDATEGRYESAISAARRILAVDPFREWVQRALAVLLTLNGQRAQAIRELRRWAEALREEIGIEPMPETSALERSIVSGQIFSELRSLEQSYFSSPTPRAQR
jgi:DNA-binding SARP family transcriptional activator